MNNLLALLLTLTLLLTGCSTGGSLTPPTPQQGATLVRLTTSTTLTLALAKNPRYIPAAQEINAQLDQVLANGSVEISAAIIARFVAPIAARHGLSEVDAALLTNLVSSIWQIYAVEHGVTLVHAADPAVRPYLDAFHAGLTDALAAVKA